MFHQELWDACRRHDPEEMREVIRGSQEESFDINGTSWRYSKMTILHAACKYHLKDCVEVLVENFPNINLNAKTTLGRTPLHHACTFGNTGAIDILVHSPGIDINARDEDDDTPLSLSMKYGKMECIFIQSSES